MRRIALMLVLLTGMPCCHAAGTNTFGWFTGTVQTEWINGTNTMSLLSDYAYVDPAGKRWFAPKGSKTDGASIPRYLWTIVGDPYSGLYRNAAVIHDVACVEKKEPWQAVHKMFYNACRCAGVPDWQATELFAGVFLFGPKWVTVDTVAMLSNINTGNVLIHDTTVAHKESDLAAMRFALSSFKAGWMPPNKTMVLTLPSRTPAQADLDKLKAFLGSQKNLTVEQVEAYCLSVLKKQTP